MAAGRGIPLDLLERGLQRNVDAACRLLSCNRLSGGANQETYRVRIESPQGERSLAVRRSLGGMSAPAMPGFPGLRAEALLMRAARAAAVPEPEVYWIFAADDGLGEGFVMQWIDGESLGKRIVHADELAEIRPKLAFLCGEILARIHSIDVEAAGLAEVLQTIEPATFVEQTWARYRSFDTAQPMIDYTARWLRDHLPPASELRLVHNDFRNGNLMVSPRGIVAVLDWELAHVGDPMRDLGWLCTNSWRFGRSDLPVGGFGTYDDLFRGYESVSGEAVDCQRVRFWEVFGSFWWAIGCLEMANAYRIGLDRSVERAAIGRRSTECQVDCVNLLIPGPVDVVAAPQAPASDMPHTAEIIASVRDYLRDDVMTSASGRTKYLARVAANSLDIAARDVEVRALLEQREQHRLGTLLAATGSADELRRRLVEALRDGSMALDHTGLAEYLRDSVANRVAVDQPKYSGLERLRRT